MQRRHMRVDDVEHVEGVRGIMQNAKTKGIFAGAGALLLFIAVGVGLYLLGGDDQSALQKIRDIALIFIILSTVIIVVLLAAIAAALAVLILQIRDRVIPMLEEATGGVKKVSGAAGRIKDTTDFVTEEAMRPLMHLAGTLAKARMIRNTVTGKETRVSKLARKENIS